MKRKNILKIAMATGALVAASAIPMSLLTSCATANNNLQFISVGSLDKNSSKNPFKKMYDGGEYTFYNPAKSKGDGTTEVQKGNYLDYLPSLFAFNQTQSALYSYNYTESFNEEKGFVSSGFQWTNLAATDISTGGSIKQSDDTYLPTYSYANYISQAASAMVNSIASALINVFSSAISFAQLIYITNNSEDKGLDLINMNISGDQKDIDCFMISLSNSFVGSPSMYFRPIAMDFNFYTIPFAYYGSATGDIVDSSAANQDAYKPASNTGTNIYYSQDLNNIIDSAPDGSQKKFEPSSSAEDQKSFSDSYANYYYQPALDEDGNIDENGTGAATNIGWSGVPILIDPVSITYGFVNPKNYSFGATDSIYTDVDEIKSIIKKNGNPSSYGDSFDSLKASYTINIDGGKTVTYADEATQVVDGDNNTFTENRLKNLLTDLTIESDMFVTTVNMSMKQHDDDSTVKNNINKNYVSMPSLETDPNGHTYLLPAYCLSLTNTGEKSPYIELFENNIQLKYAKNPEDLVPTDYVDRSYARLNTGVASQTYFDIIDYYVSDLEKNITKQIEVGSIYDFLNFMFNGNLAIK